VTNDLLDADCVIRHLHDLKIIAMRIWRDTNPDDHDYSLDFDNPKRIGNIRLQIVKRKERYFIPRSIINILSCRHRFNAGGIYSECSVA